MNRTENRTTWVKNSHYSLLKTPVKKLRKYTLRANKKGQSFEADLFVILLFLFKIFDTVECYGGKNDNAYKDV